MLVLAEDIISKNATLQSLVASSSKQSFLLSDKIYQKVTDVEDQTWLLRAAESTLMYFHAELLKAESSRYVLSAQSQSTQPAYFCLVLSAHNSALRSSTSPLKGPPLHSANASLPLSNISPLSIPK